MLHHIPDRPLVRRTRPTWDQDGIGADVAQAVRAGKRGVGTVRILDVRTLHSYQPIIHPAKVLAILSGWGGSQQPMLVLYVGGLYFLMDGHHRLEAGRILGFSSLRFLVVDVV